MRKFPDLSIQHPTVVFQAHGKITKEPTMVFRTQEDFRLLLFNLTHRNITFLSVFCGRRDREDNLSQGGEGSEREYIKRGAGQTFSGFKGFQAMLVRPSGRDTFRGGENCRKLKR
jgi:hypothetical protein